MRRSREHLVGLGLSLGKPSESTAERGEEFLRWAATAVVNLVRDMDDVHDRIGVRG
jgi:hypothetical protein